MPVVYRGLGGLDQQQENVAPLSSKPAAGELQVQQNGLKRPASGGASQLQGDATKPRVAFTDITNQAVGRGSGLAAAEDAKAGSGWSKRCSVLPFAQSSSHSAVLLVSSTPCYAAHRDALCCRCPRPPR